MPRPIVIPGPKLPGPIMPRPSYRSPSFLGPLVRSPRTARRLGPRRPKHRTNAHSFDPEVECFIDPDQLASSEKKSGKVPTPIPAVFPVGSALQSRRDWRRFKLAERPGGAGLSNDYAGHFAVAPPGRRGLSSAPPEVLSLNHEGLGAQGALTLIQIKAARFSSDQYFDTCDTGLIRCRIAQRSRMALRLTSRLARSRGSLAAIGMIAS
jgi:hypothetical protein